VNQFRSVCDIGHKNEGQIGFGLGQAVHITVRKIGKGAGHMVSGRRRGVTSLPTDLGKHLNDVQLSELDKIEGFGWSIKYIRKSEVVVVYKDGSTHGLLEKDGSLNHRTAVRVRAGGAGTRVNNDLRPPKYLV
jgi:hypothetical protein